MFPYITGILRTYNNNTNAITAIVRAMESGLGFLFVVVNGEKEEGRGTLASKIENYYRLAEYRDRIRVIEMVRGYSWSPAVNVALREIHALRTIAQINGKRGAQYVLCFSTEVEWKQDHLRVMSNAMINPLIGVVGTNFQARDDRGSKVDLGVTYCHPRNTFALWRADSLAQAGDFDPWCDTLGGQEDLEMILRMELFLDRGYVMIDTGDDPVRLSVGQNYDQKSKETRELASTRSIIELWRDRTAHNATAASMLNHILEDKFSFIYLR